MNNYAYVEQSKKATTYLFRVWFARVDDPKNFQLLSVGLPNDSKNWDAFPGNNFAHVTVLASRRYTKRYNDKEMFVIIRAEYINVQGEVLARQEYLACTRRLPQEITSLSGTFLFAGDELREYDTAIEKYDSHKTPTNELYAMCQKLIADMDQKWMLCKTAVQNYPNKFEFVSMFFPSPSKLGLVKVYERPRDDHAIVIWDPIQKKSGTVLLQDLDHFQDDVSLSSSSSSSFVSYDNDNSSGSASISENRGIITAQMYDMPSQDDGSSSSFSSSSSSSASSRSSASSASSGSSSASSSYASYSDAPSEYSDGSSSSSYSGDHHQYHQNTLQAPVINGMMPVSHDYLQYNNNNQGYNGSGNDIMSTTNANNGYYPSPQQQQQQQTMYGMGVPLSPQQQDKSNQKQQRHHHHRKSSGKHRGHA